MKRKKQAAKKVRVALIGYGRMGRNHYRVLREDSRFELVALIEPNSNQVPEELVKHTNVLKSIQDLDKRSIDAIVIATATETHYDVAVACLKFKVPVLIEKPMCATSAQCQDLSKLIKASSGKLVVGHLERFNPVVNKLDEIIHYGWIGRPIHVTFTRVGGYPQNVALRNNVLIDLAVHDIDIFSRLCGQSSVLASVCHSTVKRGIFDTAEILLTSKSGATASIHVNWITPTKIRTIRVTGTNGIAMADYMLQTCSLLGGHLLGPRAEPMLEFTKLVQAYESTDRIEFGVRKAEPLKVQLDNFYRFVRGQRNDCCTPIQAMRVLELAEEAIQNAKH